MDKNPVYRIIFIMASIFIGAGGMAYGKTEFTVEPNIGGLSGYTRYNISVPSVESELEWPIDSVVWGVKGSVAVNKRFVAGLAVRQNLDKETGKMIDSDWINNALVIYSESDTEMDMLDVDINGRYSFPYSKKTNIALIAGFRYQDFSFEAKNVVQQSVDPDLNVKVSGLVGRYDIRYSIPYIGAGFSSKIGEKMVFDLSAQVGFVNAMDEDDHVLRYKKSTGESTGNSIGISGNLVYDLSPNAFINLSSEYLFIQAYGKQTQRWYREPNSDNLPVGYTIPDIDLKIESFQALTTIGVGIRF